MRRRHLTLLAALLLLTHPPSARTLARAAGATITPEAAVFLPSGKLVYRGRINDWYTDYGKSRYLPTTHDLKDVCEAVARNQPIEPKFTTAVGCHIPM